MMVLMASDLSILLDQAAVTVERRPSLLERLFGPQGGV